MKIALAGNPNSGKTTLFNLITGKSEKVGNWAGVTVAKKESSIRKSLMKDGDSIKIIDLPGAYSMSPFTSEENVTRDFIKNENPDVIINIVDGTNLSRSLFFTTQLLELDIPVVIALNKTDLNKKQGTKIDIKALEKLLGCSIVETVSIATNNNGIESLIKKAIEVKGNSQKAPFDGQGIDLSNKKEVEENDKKRYDFVKGIVAKVEKRNNTEDKIRLQDKADRILAHKWLGLPIFAAVMWAVFSISQTYLGPLFADILVAGVDKVYAFVEGLLGANVSPLLSSILLDGIIGGVGAVIGFYH